MSHGDSYASNKTGPLSDLIPFRYIPGDRLLTSLVKVDDHWSHILEQRALIINHLGYKNVLTQPRLKVSQEEITASYKQLPHKDKAVLIHPGAGLQIKCWPVENYPTLIKKLTDLGFYPILVGGNNESLFIKNIATRLNKQIPIIRPSLRKFLALVAAAKCVICMDSAAAHIACNMNTPAVVLYGPKSRRVWHPKGGPSILLRNDVCCEHPCNGKKCPHGLPAPCMSSITTSQVLEAFEQLIMYNRSKLS